NRGHCDGSHSFPCTLFRSLRNSLSGRSLSTAGRSMFPRRQRAQSRPRSHLPRKEISRATRHVPPRLLTAARSRTVRQRSRWADRKKRVGKTPVGLSFLPPHESTRCIEARSAPPQVTPKTNNQTHSKLYL